MHIPFGPCLNSLTAAFAILNHMHPPNAIEVITSVNALPPSSAAYFNPSTFNSFSFQPHDPPTFFVEANDIVFQSRPVMFHPIYPRLTISRLLDRFHDVCVFPPRIEFLRGQGRHFRIMSYELPKLVFRNPSLAYIHISGARRRCPLCVTSYSPMACSSRSTSSSQARRVHQPQTCSTDRLPAT